jgi:hypothetical protein
MQFCDLGSGIVGLLVCGRRCPYVALDEQPECGCRELLIFSFDFCGHIGNTDCDIDMAALMVSHCRVHPSQYLALPPNWTLLGPKPPPLRSPSAIPACGFQELLRRLKRSLVCDLETVQLGHSHPQQSRKICSNMAYFAFYTQSIVRWTSWEQKTSRKGQI